MNLTFSLVFIFTIVSSSIISNILKQKHVNYLTVIGCDLNQDIFFHKQMMLTGTKLAHINSKNVEKQYQYDKSYFKSAFVLMSSCSNWTRILHNINGKSKFKILETWLVITTKLSETIQELSLHPIEVDSDFLILLTTGKNTYQLYEIYNSGFYTNGSVHVNNIGFWNGTLVMSSPKRIDMSGVVLKAMAVVNDPKPVNETLDHYLDRSQPTPVDNINKLKYFIVLQYLHDMYKFRYLFLIYQIYMQLKLPSVK